LDHIRRLGKIIQDFSGNKNFTYSSHTDSENQGKDNRGWIICMARIGEIFISRKNPE
jgi:hypothetical protein